MSEPILSTEQAWLWSLEIHIERIFNHLIKQNQKLGSDSVLQQSTTVSRVQRPESSVQNPESRVQHPESSVRVQRPESSVQFFRPWSRNSGILDCTFKAVSHSVNFRPWRFFCWSLRKICCNNIGITLRETFTWKCDINFFEITLHHHRCVHGNFSFVFGGCSWYSFVVMMIFILFIVTRGCSTKNVFSLYS